MNIGFIVSAFVVGGGVFWVFLRSWRGQDVDRRIIFLFIGLTVALAVLFQLKFGEKATPIVKALFDKIEDLPSGSKIVISYDFDPAMAPEVLPMANSFVRHTLAKGHKVYFFSLWATGQSLLQRETIEKILKPEFPDAQYGVDWINFGYKAGNEGVLNVIVTDIRKMFPFDINGKSLDSIPMMSGVRSLKDMDLLISIGGGQPGVKEWVLFARDRANVPTGGGAAAVSTPLLYPYYPRQLVGLLGGTKGAAEYEAELIHRYPRFKDIDTPALQMMGPQTMAHVVIVAFIIIGNITYFRAKRRQREANG